MATLDQVLDQMYRDGMPPMPAGHPRLNTDRIVRYGPKLRAWYRIYEQMGRNGRSYVSGVYGYWGLLPEGGIKIESRFEGLDGDELARCKEAQAAAETREREKRETRAQNAAQRAAAQWRQATKDGFSEYLKHKQVEPEHGIGLRFAADGTLLVPALRYDQIGGNGKPRLVSLQKIAPDGSKRFNKDGAMRRAAFRIGGAPGNGDPVIIAEGLATALSIRKAIDRSRSVFVAFDCGNLAELARTLRDLYPESPVLFCADDDFLTPCARHKNEGVDRPLNPDANRPTWCRCNPGRTHAKLAAAAIGKAYVIAPHFVDRGENKWTDFNDLHCAEGLYVVRAQIETGLQLLGAIPVATNKKGKAKPAQQRLAPADWEKLYERFTLIYPTETCWDAELGQIVKLSAMRVHFGDAVVKHWLESPQRRWVNAEDVVFDPSCQCDPERSVNLFRGLSFKPSATASCKRLLELLQYLCGEGGQDQAPTTDWLLKWIAYPLQHPGTKMRTAVVMHGDEGTGKNMFWGAVASIYGQYAGLINQFQLQSQFNDWASRKMFVVANEVVTRMELKHLVGYLKNLVTEPRIPIETKGLPQREEDNRMQLVFLSNELRPLHISPGDRRYMVVKTPGPRTKEYYAAIEDEINAHGAAALYDYLLHLDVGDFNEHTKPPETDAKLNLIELGLTATQYFWQELRDGMLPLPYSPALVTDVYRAYVNFCVRIGEKYPAKLPQFSHEFMSMRGVRRKARVRLPNPDDPADWQRSPSGWRQYSVFLMGDRASDESEEVWVKKTIGVWHKAAKDFVRFARASTMDDDAAVEAARSVRDAGDGDPAV